MVDRQRVTSLGVATGSSTTRRAGSLVWWALTACSNNGAESLNWAFALN